MQTEIQIPMTDMGNGKVLALYTAPQDGQLTISARLTTVNATGPSPRRSLIVEVNGSEVFSDQDMSSSPLNFNPTFPLAKHETVTIVIAWWNEQIATDLAKSWRQASFRY